ncbi:RNA polymerase sigma factor [Clostridium sp. CTA-5]
MDDISLRTDEIISEDLEKYGNMLLRLSYSYMKNIHDSEDILQDVLIKLIKNKDDFKDEEHKKSWLLCVTRNLCINKLKSSWFKYREPLIELPHYDDYTEGNDDVFESVMNLPIKYREVIHLFYYEDYTTANIALIIGKKESTVRSLLHRARKILKKTLKGGYDFE